MTIFLCVYNMSISGRSCTPLYRPCTRSAHMRTQLCVRGRIVQAPTRPGPLKILLSPVPRPPPVPPPVCFMPLSIKPHPVTSPDPLVRTDRPAPSCPEMGLCDLVRRHNLISRLIRGRLGSHFFHYC